jgi:hypothetical protein
LGKLQAAAGFESRKLPAKNLFVELWRSIPPPPALLASGDEGISEIDVVLEAPSWVWFIEAKYRSDISTGTTTRPDRDQILRNIDVGSYYAGIRDFYFSFLVRDEETSPVGVAALNQYKNVEFTRFRLAQHRPDALPNLRGIGLLTWAQLGSVLAHAATAAAHADERQVAERAASWLEAKGLGVRAG